MHIFPTGHSINQRVIWRDSRRTPRPHAIYLIFILISSSLLCLVFQCGDFLELFAPNSCVRVFHFNTLRFIKPYSFHASKHVFFWTQTCSTPHHFTCSFRSFLYLNIKRVCNFSRECLGEMTPIQLLMGTWLISAVKCTDRREGRSKRKWGGCVGDRGEELSK
jgi:hypothetical protein